MWAVTLRRLCLQEAAEFRAHEAGVANARDALDLVLRILPNVDKSRIFAAGHSSAASWALLFAAVDHRVAAVAACAPVVDARASVKAETKAWLDDEQPGYSEFLTWSSPASHLADYKVPVFLFHAKDDSVVPFEGTRDFAAELKARGVATTFVTAESGDHYDSMIKEGLPAAVNWFKSYSAKR